ncbi:MAG: Cys-tRNA(Pro) deacylase [Clostridia bacterium]|nr:Cys-tRNA(Pro) deacylase [Clostridia bacterium]
MAKPIKTNAMRMLDKAKIPFEPILYTVDENDLSGIHIADQVGLPYDMVFKTLVARGDKTGPVVFCIPVHLEIDLKKAAVATKNKKVEMIAVKDLLNLTGYIRGGCSPIGMKKQFPTFFHTEAENHEKITVSAGIKGCQLLIDRKTLIEFVGGTVCDLC